MKRYDLYKDSGIQWIGKIPSHWDSSSLLFVLRNKISDGPHETPVFVDDGIPFISIDSLNDSKDIDFSVVKKYISTEDYERYCQKTKLEEGDILFTKAATIGKTAIVRDEIFMVWSPLAILKPDYKKLTSLFLYYLVNCKELVQEAILSGSMSTQINVGMRELEKVKIPIPTLSEQNFISDYLDVKCGEIGKLIATQQRRIELLQELRQSIITRAVTRGINPDAPLRDSGIDWIGQIPVHWEVMPLKRCLKYPLMYGANESAEEDNPDDPRYIRITDIDDFGNLRDETYKTLSIEKAEPYLLKKGDVLFARSGATVGKTYMFKEDYPACFAGYLIKATCNNRLLPNYLLSYSQSGIYNNWKNCVFIQATIQNIGADKYSSLPVILPPISEQREIVVHIERETAKVDHALQQAERQIELLQELRQSVITEVVTGKRKVC